jgi:hypothetical protein
MSFPVASYVAKQIQRATKKRDKKKLSGPGSYLGVAGFTSCATDSDRVGEISAIRFRLIE